MPSDARVSSVDVSGSYVNTIGPFFNNSFSEIEVAEEAAVSDELFEVEDEDEE